MERCADNGSKFEGQWLNDVKHGHGTHTVESGAEAATYEGEYSADRKEGIGICRYSDGDVYAGAWRGGFRQGPGICRRADTGTAEVGVYNDAHRGGGAHLVKFPPRGNAVRWSADRRQAWRLREGSVAGEPMDEEQAEELARQLGLPGAPSRDVMGLIASGEGTYDGEMRDGTAHGRGTALWADGDEYTGQWVRGLRHGEGVERAMSRGHVYVGEWRAVRRWPLPTAQHTPHAHSTSACPTAPVPPQDMKHGRGVFRLEGDEVLGSAPAVYDGEYRCDRIA